MSRRLYVVAQVAPEPQPDRTERGQIRPQKMARVRVGNGMAVVRRYEAQLKTWMHARERFDLVALVEVAIRTDVHLRPSGRHYGETGDALCFAKPRRGSGDRRRIEAAAGRDGDVRRVARRRGDRDVQELARAFDVILFAGVRRRSVEVGGPVFARADAVAVDGHHRPARYPRDVAIERALLFVAMVDGDELRQSEFVDGARHARQCEQRFERGCEDDVLRSAVVEQRPVAEAVAAEGEPARAGTH